MLRKGRLKLQEYDKNVLSAKDFSVHFEINSCDFQNWERLWYN